MRVALLADIHGNLLGLDAVLEEIENEQVDRIVCLGDVAVGPQPTETLERIRSLGCPVLMGNWDAWFLDGFPDFADELGRKLVEIGSWWAGQLDDESRSYMRTFELVADLDLAGTKLAAFHGSPRSFEEGILATTPDAEVEEMLAGTDAPLLACGHTHFQLLRRVGESLLVNPGSVGLPFRRDGGVMQIAPWAEYALVTVDRDRLGVDLRRTTYDVAAHAQAMQASGMPHAGWWTSLWTDRQPAPVGPMS
jgi:putative phosphoesterase